MRTCGVCLQTDARTSFVCERALSLVQKCADRSGTELGYATVYDCYKLGTASPTPTESVRDSW